jgi:predicted DNA-binding transcriptional regulator AlpA
MERHRLHPDDIEAIARRVAALLADADGRLIDAAEVAERLGKSRDWVYENRAELGAVAMGDGPRPRLGFPLSAVIAYSTNRCTPSPAAPAVEPEPRRCSGRRRRSPAASLADYLPIRGDDA